MSHNILGNTVIPANVSYTSANGTNGSVTSGAIGNYTISSLPDGIYTLTPSLVGYSFSPTSQNVTVAGADVSQINFFAAPRVSASSGTIQSYALTLILGNKFGIGFILYSPASLIFFNQAKFKGKSSFILTTVAVSGGTTTYTGGIGSPSNALVGNQYLISGFANSGNNVLITVTASTATTLVCTTTTQVNESAPATATAASDLVNIGAQVQFDFGDPNQSQVQGEAYNITLV